MVLVLALLLVVPVAKTLGAIIDRSQAATAADAAALGGAFGGRTDATDPAKRNGGALVSYVERGDTITVVVRVGDRTATARAQRSAPLATGNRVGLHPDMALALARADRLLGQPVPLSSGLRTRAQQEWLWRNRHHNPYPVARPGTSRHESGRAVDVPSAFVPTLLRVAAHVGLCRPIPVSDPIHFELC